ncbi:MAG: hypothetical protein ACLGHT_11580 [Acidimicrobiia bacterium]
MISGWLIKVVVGIALAGFLVIEIGSPLLKKAELDDAAHRAADEAALELLDSRNIEAAKQVCAEIATEEEVNLDSCELDSNGDIAVTVSDTARSFLFGKLDATKKFYDVEAEATAEPERVR